VDGDGDGDDESGHDYSFHPYMEMDGGGFLIIYITNKKERGMGGLRKNKINFTKQ